jgi:hypothetical protein
MFRKTSNEEVITTTLRLVNSNEADTTFVIEPWTSQCSMPRGAIFEVIAHGPKGGVLEVEYSRDHIVLYGWAGSTLTVYQNGETILDGSVPVPPVPPQMSVREFVQFMFLGQKKDGRPE